MESEKPIRTVQARDYDHLSWRSKQWYKLIFTMRI